MFKEQWIDQVHSLYQTAANIVGKKTNQASHKNINNVRLGARFMTYACFMRQEKVNQSRS